MDSGNNQAPKRIHEPASQLMATTKKANAWSLLSMDYDKSFDNSDSSPSDYETSDSENVLSDAEANNMTVSSL